MEKNITQFKKYLENIGYSLSYQLIINKGIREFLDQMKKRKVRRIIDVKPKHIEDHYEYLCKRPNEKRKGALSSTIIYTYMQCLKIYFTYLEEIGQIKANPIKLLVFDKPEYKEREIASVKEIKEIYEQAENLRDRAILSLFYGCGLRRSEGEKINIRDINFANHLLYVREGKGKKRRVIPLSNKVVEDFKNYYFYERKLYIKKYNKNKEEAFILNKEGRRMSGQLFRRRFKYLLSKTSIKKELTVHGLRHSIATHLLEKGLKLESVRDFLGHDYLESTQIYTRVSKELLKRL